MSPLWGLLSMRHMHDPVPRGRNFQNEAGYAILYEKCTGCRVCVKECPTSAIEMPAVGACIACGFCLKRFECPSMIRGEDGRVKIDRLTCVRLRPVRPGLLSGRHLPDSLIADFGTPKFDGIVKSLKLRFSVIPAKAGIQFFPMVRNSRTPVSTGVTAFCEAIKFRI